jgi:hypothetical protein
MAHHILRITKEISDCKVKLVRHAFAFFDSACIVHHEYVPGGSTVNDAECVEMLSRLLRKVQEKKKRPEKWRSGWILNYYNA